MHDHRPVLARDRHHVASHEKEDPPRLQTQAHGQQTSALRRVLRFEPILHKKPSTKCPWLEIDEIEVRHDNLTLQAAIRTWRFCTTGVDGLEEISLLRDAFEIWRPQKKAGYRNRIEVRPGVIWISSRVHLEFIWILHDSSCI